MGYSMAMFSDTEKEGELWVLCCKRFIGIVPKRKTASTSGGPTSHLTCRQLPKLGSQHCGSRPLTKQQAGNRWATIPTITMTSASSIRNVAYLPGSGPRV